MIVTVTPNPSLDRTLEVELLTRGEVHRARPARLDAGGKGVNVSRALLANGHVTKLVLPLGGFDGQQLEELLHDLGLDAVGVRIAEPTRSNVTVAEADGTTTKLNAPGPGLSPTEVEAFLTATLEAAAGATWVAACGTLPPGVPDDLYAHLTTALHGAGVPIAVDSSGPALEAVLGVAPDLVKPNTEELAEATGTDIETVGEVLAAAGKLRSDGVGTVMVSLGPDGAILVEEDGVVHAETSPVTPRSTVGAGDALLAGFLAGGGRGAKALAAGVAWGTAACLLPGTAMPGPSDIDRAAVQIHPPDPGRVLRRPSRQPSTI
jgi:1-phosphofructokinase